MRSHIARVRVHKSAAKRYHRRRQWRRNGLSTCLYAPVPRSSSPSSSSGMALQSGVRPRRGNSVPHDEFTSARDVRCQRCNIAKYRTQKLMQRQSQSATGSSITERRHHAHKTPGLDANAYISRLRNVSLSIGMQCT